MAALHAASFAQGWSEAEFASLLANATTHFAITDNGFALMQVIPPEAELITISVLPVARGKGHGKNLLQQALDTAARAEATTMFLEVDATNAAALRLYANAGFTQTGTRHGYYAHPDGTKTDAIAMACAIQTRTSR